MSRLDEILAVKRTEAGALEAHDGLRELEQRAEAADATRGFERALRSRTRALIAEIKRASPSRGILTDAFDPTAMARAYERGGADAVSVLTDRRFFNGSAEDLRAARKAIRCPVLRKDFLLTRAQVVESRTMGADAVLLIVRILTDHGLVALREEAERWGMDALVEAHDREEIRRAIASGAKLIGVNNRNLDTFEVDLSASLRLRREIPDQVVTVSESGVLTREDADRLYDAGYHAILVGEGIVRHNDRESAVRSLRPHAPTGPVR